MSLLLIAFAVWPLPLAGPVETSLPSPAETAFVVPAPDPVLLEAREITLPARPGTRTSAWHRYPPLGVAGDAMDAAFLDLGFDDPARALPRSEISQAALRGGILGAVAGGAVSLFVALGDEPADRTLGLSGSGERTATLHIDGRAVATGAFAGWMLGTSLGSHLGNASRGSLSENLVSSWGFAMLGILVSRRLDREEFYLPFATFQLLASSVVERETARRREAR